MALLQRLRGQVMSLRSVWARRSGLSRRIVGSGAVCGLLMRCRCQTLVHLRHVSHSMSGGAHVATSSETSLKFGCLRVRAGDRFASSAQAEQRRIALAVVVASTVDVVKQSGQVMTLKGACPALSPASA